MDAYGNYGLCSKLWFFFLLCWYYLFTTYLCRLQLFMVLDPGRLSGTFFRLFNPFFYENGEVPLIHWGIAHID